MTANTATHLGPLLQARPIVLWVEDRSTREYLSTVWQPEDQLFQLLIAGGNATVVAVVHDQREAGYEHVFGLADRDFGESNHDRWQNPQSGLAVFKATALEVENHLLNWEALAGCSENVKRLRRKKIFALGRRNLPEGGSGGGLAGPFWQTTGAASWATTRST